MFVIVVGVAGVTSTIWWATQKSDSGKLVTEASTLGRSLVEAVVSRNLVNRTAAGVWPGPASGLNDPVDLRRDIRDAPFDDANLDYVFVGHNVGPDSEQTASSLDRFRRNITVERRTAVGADEPDEGLAQLTVTIYWDEGSLERRVQVHSLIGHGV